MSQRKRINLPNFSSQSDPTDPPFTHLYSDGDTMDKQLAAF